MALRAIRQDENIVVLKADKGNAAVTLDASGYHSKVLAILEDRFFKKLKRDPIGRRERRITNLIKAIKELLIPRA